MEKGDAMINRWISTTALREAVLLLLLAAALGIAANGLRPDPLTVSLSRPLLPAAPDSAMVDLPVIGVTPDSHSTGPVRVTTEQVLHLINRNNLVLLAARSPEEYKQGHLPAAINVTIARVYEHMDKIAQLPRDRWIVCYCGGPPCDLGELLAYELVSFGLSRVAVYESGVDSWIRAGHELETGEE